MIKKEVLTLIISEQEKLIKDIEKSVNRYRSASDLDESDTLDPEDYSHQEEAKDMQLRSEQRLIEEKFELEHLKKFKNKKIAVLDHGALVETDEHYIYIGVSIAPFKFENKTIVCVSKNTPIVASLKNKSIGELVKIGENNFTIKSIS